MIIQRLFSEKKKSEKNHKKSNAVYAAGVGSGMVGAGILGKRRGEASGIKEATVEYLRGTDEYKKAAEKYKGEAKVADELTNEIKEAQKNTLKSKNIKLKDKAKRLVSLESMKRDAKKHSKTLKNAAENTAKKVGDYAANDYLKSSKKSLALGVGASALGAGLVGKSIKMRKEEDSKDKKK
jgi:hypothetical protein